MAQVVRVGLGLDLHRVWDQLPNDGRSDIPANVTTLVDERTAARQRRDFARSDTIRDELKALGWEVIDESSGSHVQRRETTS